MLTIGCYIISIRTLIQTKIYSINNIICFVITHINTVNDCFNKGRMWSVEFHIDWWYYNSVISSIYIIRRTHNK